jgi:hypothetical protein
MSIFFGYQENLNIFLWFQDKYLAWGANHYSFNVFQYFITSGVMM